MNQRPEPDLERVRKAMRDHDERDRPDDRERDDDADDAQDEDEQQDE